MKSKPNYKLLTGLPLLVIAIGAITVVVLNNFVPHNKVASNTTAKTIAILEPADIIKQYQAPGTIDELANLYTKKTATSSGLDIINYTTDKSYTVFITATDVVQFEQKDKTALTNSPVIKSSSEAFLIKQQLRKKSPTADVKAPLFEIFDSNKTTCQLFDLPPSNGAGALLTLACTKKSAVDDQYATINKLLALYDGPRSAIANPVSIVLRTIKEDNKTLSTTDIYGLKTASGATSLIFAAIDTKWEYIGQRNISNGDTQVDNSISAALKAKTNDPKYQGFLKKYIQ